MSLWANTADGWASDPSSSGNGALASYLQSSNASAPQSNSSSQVADPSTSTPTSSVARTVQPTVSKLAYGVTGGLAAQPTALTQFQPTALATALAPSTSLAVIPTVSRAAVPTVATPALTTATPTTTAATTTAATTPATTTATAASTSTPANIFDTGYQAYQFHAPTAVAPTTTYSGPTYYKQALPGGFGDNYPNYAIYKVDPTTLKPMLVGYMRASVTGHYSNGDEIVGYTNTDASGNTLSATDTHTIFDTFRNNQYGSLTGTATGNANTDLAGVNQQLSSVLQPAQAALTVANSTNASNQASAQLSQVTAYYTQFAQAHNGALPIGQLAPADIDAQARQAASATYQTNKASADTIGQGVNPVDTSTQDAANQASLAAIASRYSTNLTGNNIGAMSRLFASAIPQQAGTNQQLSNEDYADRFNQNISAFNTAVQQQSTLDANATGTKLQSDVQGIGDAVQKLSQQVTQLGTAAGLQVNAKLQALQKQINDYNVALKTQDADNSGMVSWAKTIIGAAAAITAVVAAPVTGGASLAAGAALVASA